MRFVAILFYKIMQVILCNSETFSDTDGFQLTKFYQLKNLIISKYKYLRNVLWCEKCSHPFYKGKLEWNFPFLIAYAEYPKKK